MITELHEEIAEQFNKKKLVPYTVHLDIEKIIDWSETIANKYSLDANSFEKYTKELYWGLASIQLSLGHVLVALNDTEYPSGKKATTSEERDIPDMGLADIYFWHHQHNTWEAIYRFWERAVSVLEMRLTPNIEQKLYFDGYLEELKTVDSVSKHKDISPLYKFNKTWNKIAKMRNMSSHEESNPCSYYNVEVEFSSIFGVRGGPIPKYNYEIPNLKQEIETVINCYKKSFSLLSAVVKVCNSNVTPNTSAK